MLLHFFIHFFKNVVIKGISIMLSYLFFKPLGNKCKAINTDLLLKWYYAKVVRFLTNKQLGVKLLKFWKEISHLSLYWSYIHMVTRNTAMKWKILTAFMKISLLKNNHHFCGKWHQKHKIFLQCAVFLENYMRSSGIGLMIFKASSNIT